MASRERQRPELLPPVADAPGSPGRLRLASEGRGMANRWWVYQHERFPILGHGPVIAAFSFSAVCFSSLLRHDPSLPALRTFLVAFGTAFLFFLQLRIADEFKDFDEDSRYRPYRPV